MDCSFCFVEVDIHNPSTFTKHKGWVYSTTMKAAGSPLAYAHNTCILEQEYAAAKPRSRLAPGTQCHFCEQLISDEDKPRMLTTAWRPKRGLKIHLPSDALAWAHNSCVDGPPPQESLF